MSSFKVKNRKKIIHDNRVTLDAKHNDKIKYFKDKHKNMNSDKNRLNLLKKEFDTKYGNVTNYELTDIQINEKLTLQDEINEMQKQIDHVDNNTEEIDYLLNTGKLLYQYYNNIDAIAEGKHKKNIIKESTNPNSKSVIEFFKSSNIPPLKKNNSSKSSNKSNEVDDDDDDEDGIPIDEDEFNSNDFADTEYMTREKLLDKYMNITDDNYII